MAKKSLRDIQPQYLILPTLVALFMGAIGGAALGLAVLAVLLAPILMNAFLGKGKLPEKKLWFKRKKYGWGWYPASKEGWTTTVVYILLILLSTLAVTEESSFVEILFRFGVPCILLTIAFIRIAYKTGEEPRWQWGSKA